MEKITYQIEFFGYWHAGSGLSGATYADSLANKDAKNLPFIPGKTLKGLLRDAAEQINQFDESVVSHRFIEKIFGVNPGANKNPSIEKEGCAFFTNATLSENLSKNIEENNLSSELYQVISSTRINEDGQAEDSSLRQIEVSVPVSLYACIENFPGEYVDELKSCFGWIKQLGQNRNRGLGRCHFSILNESK